MNKNIITSSLLLFTAQIFFASNDAIINFLSPQGIQFYHFIFYGSPAYLIVPLYFFIRGELKSKILATNYYIPLFRGIIFLPIPFFAFLCLKNISLPEFTTLNMSSPIFAVIISIFILKEKLNNYIILSLVLGILGVSSFFGTFEIPHLVATFDLYFMTSVIIFITFFMMVLKKLGKKFGIISLLMYFFYIGYLYI